MRGIALGVNALLDAVVCFVHVFWSAVGFWRAWERNEWLVLACDGRGSADQAGMAFWIEKAGLCVVVMWSP